MSDIPSFDYYEQYLELEPSLFRESDNLHLLLESIFSTYDNQQQSFLWLAENILDIDIAEGYHLDFIGSLVGQNRLLIGFNTERYFGFKESYQSETFGTVGSPDVGGYWSSRIYFDTASSRRLTDDEYRRIIKARVVYNSSICTCDDLLEVINLITNRTNNTTQIIKHGLLQIKSSDDSGLLSYFIDRLGMDDNILPIAAGIRVGLDKLPTRRTFSSNLYPVLTDNDDDIYQVSVKPLDITLKQILKNTSIADDAYIPSIKPLDITLKRVLIAQSIDANDAYIPSVKPLDITLKNLLRSDNVDDKDAYIPSVKPLDITLKRVLIAQSIDDNDAYIPSVKPLDITLIVGSQPVTTLDPILHYSFNGDVLDQSANALNGIKTGAASFVSGRKVGTQALEFSGGQVVTPNILPINSNVLVMSFWIATTSVADSVIFETSADAFSSPNNMLVGLNDPNQSTINSVPFGTTTADKINVSRSPMKTDGTWQHCVISIDRTAAQGLKNRIYIDNVETTQLSEFIDPLVGNFANDVLFIGRRGSGAKPMFAKVQDVRFYNRVLTSDERTQLFNE